MLVWVWAGLAAGGAAALAALTFAAVRALAAWRLVRASMTAVGEALDDVSVRAERLAERAEAAAARSERVAAAAGPLRVSVARLRILLRAIGEVREALSAARFVPRKG